MRNEWRIIWRISTTNRSAERVHASCPSSCHSAGCSYIPPLWAAGWVGEPQRERSLRHQIVLSRIDKIAFPTITPEMDYVYFSRWLAAVIARDNVLHLDEWRRSYRKDVVLSSSAPAHTRVDRVHCAARTSPVISPPTWQDKTTQCTCMRGFHRVTKSVIVVFDMWYCCMQSISTAL